MRKLIKKPLFFAIAFLLLTANLLSQGYSIQIRYPDAANQELRIGYHYGDKTYLHSSLDLDNRGTGIMEGDEVLQKGVYFLLSPDNKHFDFIVSENQDFEIFIENEDDNISRRFKGSEENTAFINYQDEIIAFQTSIRNEIMRYDKAKLESEMHSFQMNFANKHKGTFLSKLIAASSYLPHQPFESRKEERDFKLNTLLETIDLEETGLLYSPAIKMKITEFTKMLVNEYSEWYVGRLVQTLNELEDIRTDNPVMYRYFIEQIMYPLATMETGYSEHYYVAIIKLVYEKGYAPWMHEKDIKIIGENAESVKNHLQGQIIPTLEGKTLDGKRFDLHDLECEHSILFMIKDNCQECIQLINAANDSLYTSLKKKDVKLILVSDLELMDLQSKLNRKLHKNTIILDIKTVLQDYKKTFFVKNVFLMGRNLISE